MNEILVKSHIVLFGETPDANLQDWQLAEKIMNNWNVPKL